MKRFAAVFFLIEKILNTVCRKPASNKCTWSALVDRFRMQHLMSICGECNDGVGNHFRFRQVMCEQLNQDCEKWYEIEDIFFVSKLSMTLIILNEKHIDVKKINIKYFYNELYKFLNLSLRQLLSLKT